MLAMKRFDGQRYELPAYVVMYDHVHALLAPLGPYELQVSFIPGSHSPLIRCSASTSDLGACGRTEYLDRIVRDDGEFIQKLEYIVGIGGNAGPALTSTIGMADAAVNHC